MGNNQSFSSHGKKGRTLVLGRKCTCSHSRAYTHSHSHPSIHPSSSPSCAQIRHEKGNGFISLSSPFCWESDIIVRQGRVRDAASGWRAGVKWEEPAEDWTWRGAISCFSTLLKESPVKLPAHLARKPPAGGQAWVCVCVWSGEVAAGKRMTTRMKSLCPSSSVCFLSVQSVSRPWWWRWAGGEKCLSCCCFFVFCFKKTHFQSERLSFTPLGSYWSVLPDRRRWPWQTHQTARTPPAGWCSEPWWDAMD